MSPRVPLHRPTVLVVGCCLLALFGTAVALGAAPSSGGAPAPAVVDDGNTTNYLQPGGDGGREATAVQNVDVGVAVATDAETIAGHHERARFDARIAETDGITERLERAQAAVSNLSTRTDQLRAATQANRQSFQSGSIGANEYFYRVARLDASRDRADAYRQHLETTLSSWETTPQSSITRLQVIEPDLETLDSPVADELRARYAGNATGSTFVRVTDGGYVTATVSGNRLYRVAQEGPDWNRDGPDRFNDQEGLGGLQAASALVQEQYPWAYSHQVGSPTPRGPFRPTNLYKSVLIHTHGELTLYLDKSDEDVYREVQSKALDRVPTTLRRNATAEGLALNVTGTNPTGALAVSVTQADSDVGVDADVRIDGTPVGSTGPDGQLWTVQPSGAFTVNATSPGGNVTLTVPEAS